MKHTVNSLRILGTMLVFVLLLSACVGRNVSEVTFYMTGTLAPKEKIFVRYADGIEANDSGNQKSGEIKIKTDPNRVIVGAYVSDGTVSWVPSYYGFNSSSSVTVDLNQSNPKPSKPAAKAQFVKSEVVKFNDLSGTPTPFVRATYKLNDASGQAVADGTDVSIGVPNNVTLYDNDSKSSINYEQRLVNGGYAYYTKNGVVQFDIKLDKPEDLSQVPVKLYSGTTEIYDSTKAYEFSTTLSLLEISAGELSPAFSPSTTSYTVKVPSSVVQIAVKAEALDKTSQVKVNGQAYSSGKDTIDVPLNEGSNTITVQVIPQLGDAKPYTITVNRKAPLSTDATLSGLTLSSGKLSPDFAANKTEYTASVANAVSSVQVTATATDDHAKLTIGGKSEASGKPSTSIVLKEGSNTLPVIVTAEDGKTTKSYTIIVTRAAASSGGNNGNNNDGGSSGGSSGGGISNPAPTTPTPSPSTTSGQIVIPAGKAGQLVIGDALIVIIPEGAAAQSLQITVDQLKDTSSLTKQGEVLASSVFELLKNRIENFKKLVQITMKFNPSLIQEKQRAGLFYYDETAKKSIEITGAQVKGNMITGEVDHFTKFAVLVVNQEIKVEEGTIFSDITGHWAEDKIKQAVQQGIVKGYADGSFQPDGIVTRQDFAVMLMNALKPKGLGAQLNFADAQNIGEWAKKAVAQSVEAGIVTGYSDGNFLPNKEISRMELAVMIARAYGIHVDNSSVVPTNFADDDDIESWARGAVAAIQQAAIIKGRDGNKFEPSGTTTRAEAITIIMNLMQQLSK
ncbi:S-layer homology domain-containing protein [Paenibacillus sp. KN14-4R]|uniref:S-layer homology domain-containing protein n=1 Tax=Paenibacillus sp. KN14-4R TaxID=3445773 RepID=UPI003FA0C4B4